MDIYENINDQISQVQEGELSSMDLWIRLDNLEKAAKRAKEVIKSNVINELAKYHEKTVSYNGYDFTKRDTPDTYDLEKNNRYKSLNEELKNLKKAINQASRQRQVIANDEGEIIAEPVPVKKPGEESFSLTKVKS